MKNNADKKGRGLFFGMTYALLAQTKVVGFLYVAFTTVVQVVVMDSYIEKYYSRDIRTAIDASYPLTVAGVFTFFCGVIITLNAFKYLHSKKATDFYMSLPITRTKLYLSTCSASLAWIIAGNVISSVVGYSMLAPLYGEFGVDFSGNFAEIVISVLVLTVCGVALGAFASSFTGTMGTAILAGSSVAFLPVIFCLRVENIYYRVFYTEGKGHTAFYWLYRQLTYSLITTKLTVTASMVTLMISIVLFLLGMWLFNLRKSEISQCGIPNTVTHVILRSCMPLFILWGFTSYSMKELPPVLFAFLVYITYEMGQSKKIESLIRALVWFIAVFLLGYLPSLAAYLAYVAG